MQTINYDEVARSQAAADEIANPGITARRQATHEREARLREAQQAVQRQYKQLLTGIVQGEQPDGVELTRLATALGRSQTDVANDLEDRAAEMEDVAEAQRVEDEKADLEQQIAALTEEAERLAAEANSTYAAANDLQAEIDRLHARVAKKEKSAYQEAVQKNRAALEGHKATTDRIHLLRSQFDNMRPSCNHLERLRQERFRQKHEARERESDRAMAPYVFAGQQDSLPDDVMSAAVSPKASNGPPVQDLCGRSVRLGQLDGKDVVVSVGRLA